MGLKAVIEHPWTLKPTEAMRLQEELSQRIVEEGELTEVKILAAADVAFPEDKTRAAVCILSYPQLQLLQSVVVKDETRFPYIPGLLSFRESPALLKAFEQVEYEPDVIVVDGQGVAHPRRFGIASHIGLLLGLPTIGCAKKILFGRPSTELPQKSGSTTPLLSPDGETIGMLLRTRCGVAPIVVSVGHMVSLDNAVEFVFSLCGRYRMPEPIRIVDAISKGHPPPKPSKPPSAKSLFE